VEASPEQINRLMEITAEFNSPIVAVEPEKVRHALGGTIEAEHRRDTSVSSVNDTAPSYEESEFTWGLQATNVDKSTFSGRGIRIAVLDTGLDFRVSKKGAIDYHPDFKGRAIFTTSFVTGAKTAKDDVGHGTHCTGIASGPLKPKKLPRYGIAYNSDIFIAKVLDDNGDGLDGWILAGIEWAVKNRCQIISMSLGSTKTPGKPFSRVYETVALRALLAGTLIVAAAGNDSDRPDVICAVDEPADSPSIMAVAAMRSDGQIAGFSNGGLIASGGEVDIAAPGWDVYSSTLMPTAYSYKSGTSMAAPHVAGVAALCCEANGGAVGKALWDLIVKGARPLSFPSRDVGAGLVQAP
jgi:subtilisin